MTNVSMVPGHFLKKSLSINWAFSFPAQLTFWARQLIIVGTVLCIVGYLVASLDSPYWMSVAPTCLLRPEMSPDIARCPMRGGCKFTLHWEPLQNTRFPQHCTMRQLLLILILQRRKQRHRGEVTCLRFAVSKKQNRIALAFEPQALIHHPCPIVAAPQE